jgi:drug/metabolite transporter (DMT)-like permease
VIYGVLAAVGFGTADFLTAISSRRIGTFVTLLVGQVAAMALILVYLVAARPTVTGPSAANWTLMLLGGACAGIGYFGLYRGLELGPIALVSPIVGADAAFSVALFVVILHETLPIGATAAIAITILGVVLASADPRLLDEEPTVTAKGIPYALISLVFFSVGLFAAGYYAKRFGWFLGMFSSRLGTMAVLLVWLAATRAADLRRRIAPRNLMLAVTVGLADLSGFVIFARGTQIASASIVTAASAAFALIPIAGGVLVFRERPAASQWIGVAVVIAGLVLLGLAG